MASLFRFNSRLAAWFRSLLRRGGVFRKFGLHASALVVGIGAISCATYSLTREQPAGTPGAHYVGSASCSDCHDDVVEAFARTTHASLSRVTDQLCESCHGPGSVHIGTGESFDIVLPNDANCLACHGGDASNPNWPRHSNSKALMDWRFANHRTAGVQCIDCHDAHSHAPKGLREKREFQVQHTDDTSALCLSCHQDILGRISMPYHHPIREGAMGCTSCHDPHGNQSRRLLSRNETCYQCHQAQQGPFSREHQPVSEDCTTCHDPHGSPVPKMTKVGQPMLCLQCHSLTLNRHTSLTGVVSPAALRDCTACHGAIHGSDIDAYFRH